MLICLSIVDKHGPEGSKHIGTTIVEVDLKTEDTHYDVMAFVVPIETEDRARQEGVGKINTEEDIQAMEGGAVNGLGEDILG